MSAIVSRRAYATLSGLGQLARPWAEKLSTEWKGTHAIGGNTKNYIDGQFVESKATVWHDVVDPVCLRLSLVSLYQRVLLQSTQTLLTRVPETTSTEFDQAVNAASQAYKTWSRQSVMSRQRFAIESVILPSSYFLVHRHARLGCKTKSAKMQMPLPPVSSWNRVRL